jgi:mannose/fructose/N-acetylgalactosamine-specific phosphotransferase system component IIC
MAMSRNPKVRKYEKAFLYLGFIIAAMTIIAESMKTNHTPTTGIVIVSFTAAILYLGRRRR